MVFKCCVASCNNYQKDAQMHRFPKDNHLFSLWISKTGRTDLKGKSVLKVRTNYRVCDVHFDQSAKYVGIRNKSSIKEDAVPSLLLDRENHEVPTNNEIKMHLLQEKMLEENSFIVNNHGDFQHDNVPSTSATPPSTPKRTTPERKAVDSMNTISTPAKISKNFSDSDHDSDDNSKLVIECSTPKKKPLPEPSPYEKRIIESIEDELEKRLEEKAFKSNLNVINVKNIIRQIVTNKNVLALVRKAENPEFEEDFEPEYEPKLTRAKAKELLSTSPSVPIPPVVWSTPKKNPPSEVQVLLTEDLQEDESGEDEEYIPHYKKETVKEESEDDKDSSICSSNPPSVPPPTPPTPSAHDPDPDLEPPTTWSEDGIFKIPPSKTETEIVEDANIAKRTRSKLCLTSTPLEQIEEAFIPPDITTDMYDLDCDNDDWMDFLKKFTRPLDEIAKSTEDEDQDPEYNILADEALDEIDKEELRMDRAVKISKKELNNLIAELFEYTDEYCSQIDKNKEKEINTESEVQEVQKEDDTTAVTLDEVEVEEEEEEEVKMEIDQYLLLEQQLRQHVQMLTQNFVLTYANPEWNHLSSKFTEYLFNFKFICEGKKRSAFNTVNLNGALRFVAYWKAVVDADGEEVKKMKKYVEETITTSIDRKRVGCEFIVTFPPFMLDQMSKSDVFIYPSLLPKIPFKSPKITCNSLITTTPAEDGLIAFGLEQFFEMLQEEKRNVSKSSKQYLQVVCNYLSEFMIPYKESKKIMNLVLNRKLGRCAMNPIKYYFLNNRCLPIVQHVTPLETLKILSPCQRLPNELPYQWRTYIYPPVQKVSKSAPPNAKLKQPVNNVLPLLNIVPISTLINPQPVKVDEICSNQRQSIQFKTQCDNSVIATSVPQISYRYADRLILPKGPIPPEKIKLPPRKRRRKVCRKNTIDAPLHNLIRCLCEVSQISKLSAIFSFDSSNFNELLESFESQLRNINNISPDKFAEERKTLLLTPIKNPTDSSFVKNIQQLINTMLPSMPHLGTPLKKFTGENIADSTTEPSEANHASEKQNENNIQDSLVTSNTINELHSQSTELTNTEVASVSEQECANEKDDLNDINALLIASSTVKPTGRKEPSGAEKKRAKLKREFLANLMVSTPEDPEVQKKKNELFALAYYDKMRETLELDDYHKVMQILNDYEEGDAVELYKKVEKVLRPKYVEMADEFLLFLREKEAAGVLQLIPWIRMNNRSKFLRKLEIYFKDQPAQLRKIYKCLTELSQDVNVSIEKIKNTLLPMFKGNAVLTDLFLQNFLDEQPPPSLLEGPYETIDLKKESSPVDDETYETLVIPDAEDKYGGPSCICNCHHIEDPEFKSRFRHCIRCGTKFVKGKIYIQTGRGLRPATVSFLNNPNADHSLRLQGPSSSRSTSRQRKGLLRQMVFSPTKENMEEDSDDEVDGQKRKKNSPGRRRKQTLSDSASKDSKHKHPLAKRSITLEPSKSDINSEKKSVCRKRKYSVRRPRKSKKSISENENEKCDMDDENKLKHDTFKPGSSEGQVKRFADESSECEEVTAQDSNDNLKSNSPEHQTAESESECCEESSQDNCESDSNSSTSSCNIHSQSDSNAGDEESWTRDEDKLILETFKRENHKERAFQLIAEKMKHRRISQIRNRFDTLMGILMETMIGDC